MGNYIIWSLIAKQDLLGRLILLRLNCTAHLISGQFIQYYSQRRDMGFNIAPFFLATSSEPRTEEGQRFFLLDRMWDRRLGGDGIHSSIAVLSEL
jgi:hypothetical protein